MSGVLEPYYQDELVTIYHADCRDHLGVFDEADVLVTDPPYGIAWSGAGYNGGRAENHIANDADTTARDEVLAHWANRPGVVFGDDKRARPADVRQVLIWEKPLPCGLLGARAGWFRNWEAIYLVGAWPKRAAARSSVLRFGSGSHAEAKATGHSHTKPVALMRSLLEAAPPGTIIDPFMGSGSTLVAAQQLGRRCIGFDVDERWCKVAASRVSEKPLFADGAA